MVFSYFYVCRHADETLKEHWKICLLNTLLSLLILFLYSRKALHWKHVFRAADFQRIESKALFLLSFNTQHAAFHPRQFCSFLKKLSSSKSPMMCLKAIIMNYLHLQRSISKSEANTKAEEPVEMEHRLSL